MEIKQLRYFVAVAKELHFSRAAEQIGIDQAQLSRHIRALERGVGVRLLFRTTRCTRLTCVGQTILEDAQRVISIVDSMERTARQSSRLIPSKIKS